MRKLLRIFKLNETSHVIQRLSFSMLNEIIIKVTRLHQLKLVSILKMKR
jgi:hypothetical protein